MKTRSHASAAVLGVLLCLSYTTAASAQTTTGSIRGATRAADGSPLPGVTVTLVGERGAERSVTTGEGGTYFLGAVAPGLYTVEATLEGMVPQRADGVRVTIAGSATIDFLLGAESVSEEVTVTAERPLLELTTSKMSTNFQSEFVEDLPTRRNFWDMVQVSPGMSSSTEWTSGQSAFGSGIANNTWNVDGLNVTAPETGGAWWYLNPETIEEIQVLGVGASAEFGNMTGAAINVVTKSGTNEYRGSFNSYLQFDELTDTNVELEGTEFPTYVRDRYHNITGTLGGPIRRDKAFFFVAAEHNRDRESVPGTDPAFPAAYDWERYDAKLDFTLSQSTRLDAKLHWEDFLETDSGSPYVAPSARGAADYSNPAWGLSLDHVFSQRTLLEASYAGWWGDEFYESMTGSQEPAFADYSPPGGGPTQYYGGLLFPFEYETYTHQVDVKVSHYTDEFLGGEHDFRFGVSYNYGAADTLSRPGSGGGFYYHYTYEYDYYGTIYPYEYYYLYTFRPFFYGARQDAISAFVDDNFRINDRLTLNLGVRFDHHSGRIPSYDVLDDDGNPTGETLSDVNDVIDWDVISPRLGFAWVATKDSRTVVRGSFGVYYNGSVNGNWNYPPPGLPPIQTFLCDGLAVGCDDLDSEFIFPLGLNVDPGLDPPRALQYSLGVDRQLGKTMRLGAMLVYKDSDDMIGWEVLDDGIYEPFTYTDPFTGQEYTLRNICEDGCRAPTVRKGNRPGAGSLAPDESYSQEYRAFVLTFDKRYADRWSLMGSYTLSRSEGLQPRPLSQNQGSTLFATLDGSDPNEWLNARQVLPNDREHMLRMQGNVDLPWNLEATGSLNWQTGRPFARIDRARLDQGSVFFVIDPASDDTRLPSTLMLDLALGKRFQLGGDLELKLDVQVFNVLNEDANTFWESLWVGPDEQYVASDFVWPRRVMIRLGLEF
jgi:outer membrane receptor protein involved in Fe transport